MSRVIIKDVVGGGGPNQFIVDFCIVNGGGVCGKGYKFSYFYTDLDWVRRCIDKCGLLPKPIYINTWFDRGFDEVLLSDDNKQILIEKLKNLNCV